MGGVRKIGVWLTALASPGLMLAGCGGNGLPSPSDARFIDSFSEFSAPVKLDLPLDSSGLAGGGLAMYGIPRACILSRLADSGIISISPSAEGAPWWKARSTSATISGNAIEVPVGSRAVTAKTNEQTWQADGKDYYAATYAYVVKTPRGFAGPAPHTLGPFSVRATFVKDPAVGQWAPFDQAPAAPSPAPAASPDAGNGAAPAAPDAQAAAPPPAPDAQTAAAPSLLPQAPAPDASAPAAPAPAAPPAPVAGIPVDQNAELTALMNLVFPDHTCTVTIEARTGPARTAAFATIEGQLAQKGIIARGTDPATLTSRNSGLTWYAGLVNLAGRTLGDAHGLCAGLTAKGAGPWRVPTSAEMKTLIAGDQNLAQWPGKPFDAPDHRLFGAVTTAHPDETLRFYTSNSWPVQNGLSDFDTFEFSGFSGAFQERPIAAQSAQAVRLGSFDRVLCVSGQNGAAPAPAAPT